MNSHKAPPPAEYAEVCDSLAYHMNGPNRMHITYYRITKNGVNRIQTERQLQNTLKCATRLHSSHHQNGPNRMHITYHHRNMKNGANHIQTEHQLQNMLKCATRLHTTHH